MKKNSDETLISISRYEAKFLKEILSAFGYKWIDAAKTERTKERARFALVLADFFGAVMRKKATKK